MLHQQISLLLSLLVLFTYLFTMYQSSWTDATTPNMEFKWRYTIPLLAWCSMPQLLEHYCPVKVLHAPLRYSYIQHSYSIYGYIWLNTAIFTCIQHCIHISKIYMHLHVFIYMLFLCIHAAIGMCIHVHKYALAFICISFYITEGVEEQQITRINQDL